MVPLVPARGACPSYGSGHAVHPTQARHRWRDAVERHAVHRVEEVAVEDSGLVTLTLTDTVEQRWNHDPAGLRDLLARCDERLGVILAEPDLLVVGGVGVSVCGIDAITACPGP